MLYYTTFNVFHPTTEHDCWILLACVLSFLLFLPNATAAPLEFPLDEKWFEDEMEQISDLLEQKKAKASR